MVKRLPTMQETRVRYLGWENPLEEEMAPHSSTLAWKIPWMEGPGRVQSMGVTKSQTRMSDFTFTFTKALTPFSISCLVAKSCLTLCNPMNCSTPGSSVLHYLPEFAQEGHFIHSLTHFFTHSFTHSFIQSKRVKYSPSTQDASDSFLITSTYPALTSNKTQTLGQVCLSMCLLSH